MTLFHYDYENAMYTIHYLADKPEFIETVARWYWEEWHRDIEKWSLDYVTELVGLCCNKNKLNINMIALTQNGEPAGAMSLLEDEFLPGWENKKPWLGGLYIAPKHRNKGLAYRLSYTLMNKAMNMGFDEVYLFTKEIHKLPQRHHFVPVGEQHYGEELYTIYRKDILSI